MNRTTKPPASVVWPNHTDNSRQARTTPAKARAIPKRNFTVGAALNWATHFSRALACSSRGVNGPARKR